ncbi:MAG TPA: 16S rRNA (uracil(1498)-N(3))-methyltransferase [Burkholderiaceae bacterium]
MRLARFYLEEPLSVDARVALPAAVAHHARTVLRLGDGDPVVLFNGSGGEYRARLAGGAGAAPWQAEVVGFDPVEREASLRITLIQAQATSDKIDWVLEKAVEIGVARVIVTTTARSSARLDESRLARRLQHWRALVIAACCQCGRNRPPAVLAAPSLAAAVMQANDAQLKWMLDPAAAGGMTPAPSGVRQIAMAVGPEGGFDADEAELLVRAGYGPISLGPRILRTETAGLAAAAACLALSGEYRREPA